MTRLTPSETAPHACVDCDNACPTEGSTLCFRCLREALVFARSKLLWHGIITQEESRIISARIRKDFGT